MELWNKVKKRFEEHPECVDMELFSDINTDVSCMTVGCIAGWAVFEAESYPFPWVERATELLEISDDQADKLFYVDSWPEDLQNLYEKSLAKDGHPARAVLAAMNAFERGEF